MSSSSLISTLQYLTIQINIYAGLSIFIGGIIGNLVAIFVFLSLQTFRRNSCSFYLIIVSIVNIGQLSTGLLSRITINISGIDWTSLSLVYCKLRAYFLVVCTIISMICLCLATIDQYFATCRRPRWQQWSQLKSARYFSIISIIFSLLAGFPCLIYYIHRTLPTTGEVICIATDDFFNQLNIYFYRLILTNILPLSITLVFGSLAYRNVQQIPHRTLPLVRRELDKQLTSMILVQDLFTFFVLLPIMTLGILSIYMNTTQNSRINAEFQFANVIAVMFYYLYFAAPFYIYVCVSERFRRQLKHVFITTYLNRCRMPRIRIIQVTPHN